MPQATATASGFQQAPLDIAPATWSGRLDPTELRRPGGMLIAALVQCASERGLSLSRMAAAMGVSYWDISQLRIGFRRMKVLDDDFAAACAEFLELPHLTVSMLAGLLDPPAALTSQAVTAEDIVYARHLLATEPAEVELPRPLNPARPLQGMGVDELVQLHREYGGNPAVLQALRAELRHRPLSRTELLRAAVEGRFPGEAEAGEAQPAPGIMRCLGCQTRLRIPHLAEPGEIRCPACRTEYSVHWQAAVCVVQRHENSPESDDAPSAKAAQMTDGEACALLGVAEDSPWNEIERTRRSLLQHYHPDKLGHVSPLVQKLAEEAFKRVNDAYDILRSKR